MKLRQVTFSLLILVGTFFIGISAVMLCAAREINSYPSSVRESYLFNDKEHPMTFLNAYQKGKIEAQTDSEQGKLILKVTGLGADPEVEKKRFTNIYQKYAIECDRIADCVVTTEIIGYK